MSVHEAVQSISSADARRYIGKYFGLDSISPRYTGSYFEELSAVENDPGTITAADLLAVQTLSVKVPARAAIGILGDLSPDITDLLAKIPASRDLASVTDSEHEGLLGKESPAQQLWDLLRQTGKKRWGIGATTASKIMARKRPHLIPIEDSVVNRVTKMDPKNSWGQWREALRVDGTLEARAADLRDHANRPELTTLRTLDIVLWVHGNEPSKG